MSSVAWKLGCWDSVGMFTSTDALSEVPRLLGQKVRLPKRASRAKLSFSPRAFIPCQTANQVGDVFFINTVNVQGLGRQRGVQRGNCRTAI